VGQNFDSTLALRDGKRRYLLDWRSPLPNFRIRFVRESPLYCPNSPDISRSLMGAAVRRDHGGNLKESTPPALVT
jgi:hypothetical protein